MNIEERFTYLIRSITAGAGTADECQELLELLKNDTSGIYLERLNSFFESERSEEINIPDFKTPYWEQPLAAILKADKQVEKSISLRAPIHRVHFLRRFGWWAAALLILAFTAYLWQNRQGAKSEIVNQQISDLLPGRNGAILTLSNGKSIVLDSLSNGFVTTDGKSDIELEGGSLTYRENEDRNASLKDIGYNTMTTPRGRQYQIVLPDGTAVWLNAASSIKFPTSFTGKERRVIVNGEAYFEVVKDKSMPFIVDVEDKYEVEVLGTHFNINAYTNENIISTSLLEGSVNMREKGNENSIRLMPGQQANVARQKQITLNEHPDMNTVMAWRNGQFQFDGTKLSTIMREVERWYDVEVIFQGDIQDERFVGTIPRNLKFSQFMKVLALNELKFTIEGKKVILTQ